MILKCISPFASPHAALKLERSSHGDIWISVHETRNGREVVSEPIKLPATTLLSAITSVMEPGNEKP